MATVSPSWAYTLQLPHDPRAPGIARATLRTVLAAHDLTALTPTAELLASELLTNAHLHTRGPYALRIRGAGGGVEWLRIAVWDSDPQVPAGFGDVRPQAVGSAEGGRGLQLVQACADAWGAYTVGAGRGGKLLWAECACEG
ncbi:ATP-binding protein [Streptomyces sp. NBC_01340]|uniref:ATP-binding protein n=1 Tax=unclassified Streptomyces TaxID=2593676 RepID=UPI00225B8E9A|nr:MULTISPECIES: ATP-binding protein [unclassified Streptomyces]MCX4455148.1 ATP-binding protein [Streptomyces sp. NBC_01719]MCX4494508.1 ATP-binding protein [Streptomyces sp. NBC_01728]MCX4590966.1 ATP-binding protein [Streptomyces sp. NBC_01549]WSI39563.1 ATP-binding protein [Streptomyces sp. NBC_01340]